MKYHPVTKEELDMIKNDCAYPEREFCDDCKLAGAHSEGRSSGLECKFKGANALMDEVAERPDPLEMLEKRYVDAYLNSYNYNEINAREIYTFVKHFRENLQAVMEEGIKNGWWKE